MTDRILTALGEACMRRDPSGELLAGAYIYGGIALCVVALTVAPVVGAPLRLVDWVRGAK